jgi:hypothetical protein
MLAARQAASVLSTVPRGTPRCPVPRDQDQDATQEAAGRTTNDRSQPHDVRRIPSDAMSPHVVPNTSDIHRRTPRLWTNGTERSPFERAPPPDIASRRAPTGTWGPVSKPGSAGLTRGSRPRLRRPTCGKPPTLVPYPPAGLVSCGHPTELCTHPTSRSGRVHPPNARAAVRTLPMSTCRDDRRRPTYQPTPRASSLGRSRSSRPPSPPSDAFVWEAETHDVPRGTWLHPAMSGWMETARPHPVTRTEEHVRSLFRVVDRQDQDVVGSSVRCTVGISSDTVWT